MHRTTDNIFLLSCRACHRSRASQFYILNALSSGYLNGFDNENRLCVRFGHEGVVTYISTSQKGNRLNKVIVQRNIINHLPFSSKARTPREMVSDLYRRGYRPVPSLLTQHPPISWDLPLAKRPIQTWQLSSFNYVWRIFNGTWRRTDKTRLVSILLIFLEIAYIFCKAFEAQRGSVKTTV